MQTKEAWSLGWILSSAWFCRSRILRATPYRRLPYASNDHAASLGASRPLEPVMRKLESMHERTDTFCSLFILSEVSLAGQSLLCLCGSHLFDLPCSAPSLFWFEVGWSTSHVYCSFSLCATSSPWASLMSAQAIHIPMKPLMRFHARLAISPLRFSTTPQKEFPGQFVSSFYVVSSSFLSCFRLSFVEKAACSKKCHRPSLASFVCEFFEAALSDAILHYSVGTTV